jgi:hypothetical protein
VTVAVLAASCAQRAFGVETEKEFDEKRAKVVRRSFDPEDPGTRIEVASEHHATAATVYRWIREPKEDHPSISMSSATAAAEASGSGKACTPGRLGALPRLASPNQSPTRSGWEIRVSRNAVCDVVGRIGLEPITR